MRVLLIEDNVHDQKFIEQSLRPFTTEIVIRNDEKSIFELLPEIDLVILDLNLGYVEGKKLLKKIKRKRKTVPVIVYTTSENQADVKFCYSNGANCYVTKPFGFRETLEKLNNLGLFWKGVTYAD
jgi:DNA-binding response OmpR family regulator